MVPLSLGRGATGRESRRDFHAALAWLSPVNTASANNAERRAAMTWLALFITVLVAVAFGHVWLRLQVRDLGYRQSSTRQLIEKLEQEGHELTVEAARLDAPGRLEEVARVRLGMMRPASGQEVVLP